MPEPGQKFRARPALVRRLILNPRGIVVLGIKTLSGFSEHNRVSDVLLRLGVIRGTGDNPVFVRTARRVLFLEMGGA